MFSWREVWKLVQRQIEIYKGHRFSLHTDVWKILDDRCKKQSVSKSALIQALIKYWKYHPEIVDLTQLRKYGQVRKCANGEPYDDTA